jgi:hypothetical protein
MGGRESSTNKRRDVLDKVCEWTEKFLCPTPKSNDELRNMPEPQEDMIDYVFQHTESLICHQEGCESPYLLQRNNSLIALEDQIMTTTTTRRPRQRPVKSLGQEQDCIDYVFENAESLVCVDRCMEVDMRTESAGRHGRRVGHTSAAHLILQRHTNEACFLVTFHSQ